MNVPDELRSTVVPLERPRLDPLLVAALDPRAPAAERFRILHQRLGRVQGGRPAVVAVTSALLGEGKTVTAANLAITGARSGARVLLVECDLRHPSLRSLFGLPPAPSLADVLAGRCSAGPALQRTVEGGPMLLAQSEPHPDPCTILASIAMQSLIRELAAGYDEIYLDAPPVLPFADAQLVAALAQATLLVVRAGVTPRARLGEALEALSGSHVAGLVLNGVDR